MVKYASSLTVVLSRPSPVDVSNDFVTIFGNLSLDELIEENSVLNAALPVVDFVVNMGDINWAVVAILGKVGRVV